ncbi:hypothetical protein ABG461_004206 [Escherichia coli]
MKVVSLFNILSYIPFFIFSIGPAIVMAETKIYNTNVVVDIPSPTCSLSAPGTVNLGELTPGMKINSLPDFNIEVDCADNIVNYGVYMTSKNEKNTNFDSIYLETSKNTRTNILLQIIGSNGNSRFTADNNNPVYISEGTHQNKAIYPAKITVYVPDDAKSGQVSGTVSFLLHYFQ